MDCQCAAGAIADGCDLGWKLSWVLKGWAGEELLDTSAVRWSPTTSSARSTSGGSYRDPIDEIHIDLGGRIAHLWVETERGRVSTLDLVSGGLTLFTDPDGETGIEAPASLDGSAPVTVRELPAMTARPGDPTRGLAARPAEWRSRAGQIGDSPCRRSPP